MNVFAVPPWKVEVYGAALSPLMRKACSRSDMPASHYLDECVVERAVMWILEEAGRPFGVCITHKEISDDGTTYIWISVIGGKDRPGSKALLTERLRAFRRAEGAQFLAWAGRKGWARICNLAPVGFIDGNWRFEDYS